MPEKQKAVPTILIVEDEAPIAKKLIEGVTAGGWHFVGPAATLADARKLIEASAISAAVLDLILGGEYVYDLAAMLQERGIPFALTSGLSLDVPEELGNVPIIRKPFQPSNVEAVIRGLLR